MIDGDTLELFDAEAARLIAEGMPIRDAYREAIVTVIMVAIEGKKVDPFEVRLIETIRKLGYDGRPVPSTRLGVELGLSTWAVWYHCSDLRRRGLVDNIGKRGWVA